jgi:hypothetical protein
MWSENTRVGRELSGALVATLAGMALANLGFLPPHPPEVNVVFKVRAPGRPGVGQDEPSKGTAPSGLRGAAGVAGQGLGKEPSCLVVGATAPAARECRRSLGSEAAACRLACYVQQPPAATTQRRPPVPAPAVPAPPGHPNAAAVRQCVPHPQASRHKQTLVMARSKLPTPGTAAWKRCPCPCKPPGRSWRQQWCRRPSPARLCGHPQQLPARPQGHRAPVGSVPAGGGLHCRRQPGGVCGLLPDPRPGRRGVADSSGPDGTSHWRVRIPRAPLACSASTAVLACESARPQRRPPHGCVASPYR